MSDNFYTNVQCFGDTIFFRGIVNGRKVRERLKYAPSLFISAKNNDGEYKTLDEEPLEKIQFESVKQAKDFVKRYEGVEGFKIFGNTRFENAFIAEHYPGIVQWSMDQILVGNIDIEVKSDDGFPHAHLAEKEVLVISFKLNNGMFYCLHRYKDYKAPQFVKSIYCDDEIELLKMFLDVVANNYPDIWTGWNIKYFDIPYLYNRITKILGEKEAKRMSPWGMVHDKRSFFKNKEVTYYKIQGIETLDYMEVFIKFDKDGASQESYKLHDVCQAKIKEGKLSYEEYDSLNDLWNHDKQKYIDYNIQDVNLVTKLDIKLKLIELALTLAYYTHSNFEDVFQQVRMWDSIIYNFLLARKIIIPPRKDNEKNAKYEGAYVKEPIPGKYKWVVSFDLASLYPHLIMQYRISPDTFVERAYLSQRRKLLKQEIEKRKASLTK